MGTGARVRPRVVIVDVHVSDSFREFDAALRRHGVDVLYLRPPHVGTGRRVKSTVDRFSGPTLPLTADFFTDAGAAIRAQVLAAPTLDVHATEPVLGRLAVTPEWRANPALHKVRPDLELGSVVDKLLVTEIARDAGVEVPRTSTTLESDEWPIVVKGRLGAGGQSVRVAHDEAELREAVRTIGAGDSVYLERYHPGLTMGTCGVARAGEILVQGAYERAASRHDPLGPPVKIRLIEDALATAASERLIRALGYTGMWCLNFVRDDDGRPLLIDVNIRAFGSWLSLDDAGVPLLDAYRQLIGEGPEVRAAQTGEGPWLDVARIGIKGNGPAGEVLRESGRSSRLIWSRRPRLGLGWAVTTQFRIAQATASGVADAVRRRSR